jgi:hypothetical protein
MSDPDRSDLRILLILVAAAVVVVGLALMLGGPLISEAAAVLEPGIGLRTAALWSFGVTVVLFIVFALVADDGLLGEIQYMLGAFFSFFAIITLLIAWVF